MKKVLVVDDERDIRKLFGFLLERQGYRVELAEDGIAGLEAIRWFKPELVLLNILMPRMDGIEMLRVLGQESQGKMPRVVMASACSRTDTFELTISLGALDFIEYPFVPKAMLQIVRDVLEPSLDMNQYRIKARLRWVKEKAEEAAMAGGGIARIIERFVKLSLEELSSHQCRELRAILMKMAQNRLNELSSLRRPRRSGKIEPGIEPALTALALAQALGELAPGN